MKQIIYRRKGNNGISIGGYAVTGKAASITAEQRTAAQGLAQIPIPENVVPITPKPKPIANVLYYKQCKIADDTLVVSCGYDDPYGDRGSYLSHTVMTENRSEMSAYLSRLPSDSGYFAAVRKGYDEEGEMGIEKGDMMMPLEEYFASASMRPEDALTIIKKELGSAEMVAQMLSALLDVSGANPRTIVVFMDVVGMDVDGVNSDDMNSKYLNEVGCRGRRLAESLMYCLPEAVAASVGYMSPAVEDVQNSIFGIRFALSKLNEKGKREQYFAWKDARHNAYIFDLPQGKVEKPRSAEAGAEEYVQELTSLVMQSDASAMARIAQLRDAMNDSSCFKKVDSKNKAAEQQSVPAQLGIRYALITRPDRLDATEMHRVLVWRKNMIDEALTKGSDGFNRMVFWSRVNDWTLNVALPELWRNQGIWKKNGGAFDPDVVTRVFTDSQRLHTAGYDMSGYRDFVAQKLAEGQLYAQSEEKLRDSLTKYFAGCVKDASSNSPVPLHGKLYFEPVENWMRTVWLAMRPVPRSREMLVSVGQLYATGVLDSDKMQVYVDSYSELIFDGRKGLYTADETRFYSAVMQAVVRNHPEKLAESMREDLKGKNPYTAAGDMRVWQWYRNLVKQIPELENEYLAMNRANLEKALAKTDASGVPALVNELRGSGTGMIVCAGRLDASLNAREMIERRIAAVSKTAGIGGYYPGQIELAGTVAEFLDNYEGRGWMRRHQALTDVCNMNPHRLSMDDFDRFAQIVGNSEDAMIANRARELLKEKLARVEFAGASMESMLIGLCMLTLSRDWNGDAAFNPQEAAAHMKDLNFREKKLTAWCKKNADPNAEDGVGYLADAMYDCLKLSEKKRSDKALIYPREVVVRGRRRPLEGLPMAVPVVGVVVFGCGFVASTLGLLSCIGLL